MWLTHIKNKMQKQRGFTLLELIMTLAIIGVLSVVATQSGLTGWSAKREGKNAFTTLVMELQRLKHLANTRNTSMRVILTGGDGTYTFTTYQADTPVSSSNCTDIAAVWTEVTATSFEIGDTYQIDGTAVDSLCFNRDGSSSGGTYVISPIQDGTDYKTYTLTITISTGFIDVVES